MTGQATDVIVVGAGPVGLLLAAELRLGGADVTVLERLAEPSTESRASTLHARTMEFLDCRGLLPRFGMPPNEPMGHFGGISLDLRLASPFPGQWKVPQPTVEQVLRDWAEELGVRVLRGHEVRALTEDEHGVEVIAGSARLRCGFLVGCDGERSTVRALVGADLPGEGARCELLRADVAGIDIPNRRFERLPQGLAIAARRPDAVTRVMVHVFGRPPGRRAAAPEFAEVVAAWRQVTGEDISFGQPLWVNAFDDARRLLADYRHGRVLFAGDAAHRQLPTGGQALNLGLQDAANLGWKLALVARGQADTELLDSYHAERHEIGRRVLANIGAQSCLLLGGPEVEPVRELLAELLHHDAVRENLAGTIAGLDIDYDPDAGQQLVGRRLPRPATAIAGTGWLSDGRGLLLGSDAELALARPWADLVRAEARAPDELRVLVRPDGYVAWAGPDSEGLAEALPRWFGPPMAA